MRLFNWLPIALAARQQSVQPIAMGLTPPPFFSNAIKEAPKKKGLIEEGVSPFTMMLTRSVRALRRTGPPAPAEVEIRSLRCCGLSPSGPPADPLGKDMIDCKISSSLSVMCEASDDVGHGGMMDWGCGGGCFSHREASVASHLFAIESSEEASRTAPLTSPSSNLAATRAAKCHPYSYS